MTGTTSGIAFERSGQDVHMTVFRGKSLAFEVIWGGSTPIDVTGYAAALQIRDSNGNLLLELSTANGKAAVGGADGRFTFAGDEADTRAVASVGVWELELTAPSGDVYRAMSGSVSPVEEIVV